MHSSPPIAVATFSRDHETHLETELEPFRWGRLLVLALVLTAAACSAAWLVENDRLGEIIDSTFHDATMAPVHSA